MFNRTIVQGGYAAYLGNVTGNVTGNVSGSSGTCTGNAGSATILATTRAIYGNNFDGSAALTQVIGSAYGGTGNGFAKFSGPTTSEKTFTLPNASATIATSTSGTWTPTDGSGGGVTFTVVYATYTATNVSCTIQLSMTIASNASAVAAVIHGIPTPSGNAVGTFLDNRGASAIPAVAAVFSNATPRIVIYKTVNANAATNLELSTAPFILTITYPI